MTVDYLWATERPKDGERERVGRFFRFCLYCFGFLFSFKSLQPRITISWSHPSPIVHPTTHLVPRISRQVIFDSVSPACWLLHQADSYHPGLGIGSDCAKPSIAFIFPPPSLHRHSSEDSCWKASPCTCSQAPSTSTLWFYGNTPPRMHWPEILSYCSHMGGGVLNQRKYFVNAINGLKHTMSLHCEIHHTFLQKPLEKLQFFFFFWNV